MKQPIVPPHSVVDPNMPAVAVAKGASSVAVKAGPGQAVSVQDVQTFQQSFSQPQQRLPQNTPSAATATAQEPDKLKYLSDMVAAHIAEHMPAPQNSATATQLAVNQPSAELLAPVLAKTGLTLPDSPEQMVSFVKQLDQLSANHQVNSKDVELLLQQMAMVMEAVVPAKPALDASEKVNLAAPAQPALRETMQQAIAQLPLPAELKAAVQQVSAQNAASPSQVQQLNQMLQQLPVPPAQQHLVQKIITDFVLPAGLNNTPLNVQASTPASVTATVMPEAKLPPVQGPNQPALAAINNGALPTEASANLAPKAELTAAAQTSTLIGNGTGQDKPDSLEGLLQAKAILPTPETLLQQVMAQPKSQGAGLQQLSAEMIANIDIAKAKAGEEMTVKLAHSQFAGSEVNFKLENNVFVLTFTAKEPEHAQLAQLLLPDLKQLLEEKFPQFKHDVALQRDDEHESEWAQQQEQESQQDGQPPEPQENEDELA